MLTKIDEGLMINNCVSVTEINIVIVLKPNRKVVETKRNRRTF